MIPPDSQTVLISYISEPKLLQLNHSRRGGLLLERFFTWWMVSQMFHLTVPSEGHHHSGEMPLHRADPHLPIVRLCLGDFYGTQAFQWGLAQPVHSSWAGRHTAMEGLQLPCSYSWKKLVVKENSRLKKTTTARLWKSCSLCALAGCAPREARLGWDPGFKPVWMCSVVPPGTVATDCCPRRQSWNLPGAAI